MNMVKLGIVSGVGIDFDGRKFLNKINKMRMSFYTLCVFHLGASRYGLRHSFAFDIPPLTRGKQRSAGSGWPLCGRHDWRSLFDLVNRLVCRVALLVPLQLIPKTESHGYENPDLFSASLPSKPYGIRAFAHSILFRVFSANYSMFAVFVTFRDSTRTYSSPLLDKALRWVRVSLKTIPGFCVPHLQAPKYSDQPAQQLEGSGRDFGQVELVVRAEGDNRPSEKPPLMLTLTPEQLSALAFAVYCQACSLEDSHEADEPEVIEAMNRLNEVSAMCIALQQKGALS